MTPDPLAHLQAVAAEFGADELQVLVLVAERLALGRRFYGELTLATDRRDFQQEALEECADAAVYAAAGLLQARLTPHPTDPAGPAGKATKGNHDMTHESTPQTASATNASLGALAFTRKITPGLDLHDRASAAAQIRALGSSLVALADRLALDMGMARHKLEDELRASLVRLERLYAAAPAFAEDPARAPAGSVSP